jgi:hypothetical protein
MLHLVKSLGAAKGEQKASQTSTNSSTQNGEDWTLANHHQYWSIRQRKTKLAFQAPAHKVANAGGDSEKIGGLR